MQDRIYRIVEIFLHPTAARGRDRAADFRCALEVFDHAADNRPRHQGRASIG
jgi:hypothetical protein